MNKSQRPSERYNAVKQSIPYGFLSNSLFLLHSKNVILFWLIFSLSIVFSSPLPIRFVHVLLAHVLLSLNRQYWMGKIVVKDVEFLSRRTHIESFSDIFRYYSSCTFFRLFLKDGWSQTYTVLCLLFLYLLVFFFFIIHRRRLFVCNAYISFFRLGRYFIFLGCSRFP